MENIADDIFEESDEEGEAMTAADVLQKLEEAWLNEKFSPELLETRAEVVECMMEQISQMEDNIQKAKKGDFKVSIHRMEIDRIRFILSSYLRTRLEKIERFTSHILEKEAEITKSGGSTKLSPQELAYAKEYHENIENHLKAVALKHMPPNLQSLDPKQTAVRPNLDGYVYLRVLEDTEGVMVEEETADTREELVDFVTGDQHVISYKPVAGLIAAGAVALI